MQRQTAADALIDAGREALATVGSGGDRSEPNAADPAGTLVVGTLLILAVAKAPILVVALVGYAILTARDPDRPVSRYEDWVAVCVAGVRGTALLVGAALPAVAALAGSGLLDVEAGAIAIGAAPGPVLGVGIGALAIATWHSVVVGIAAVTVGDDWDIIQGVRFGRSVDGIRLSIVLVGLTGGVVVVAFGLTAIPLIGRVLAAGAGAVGVAVAGRLVGQAVATSALRSGPVGEAANADRLAVPGDGSERIPRGYRGGTVQRDTRNVETNAR